MTAHRTSDDKPVLLSRQNCSTLVLQGNNPMTHLCSQINKAIWHQCGEGVQDRVKPGMAQKETLFLHVFRGVKNCNRQRGKMGLSHDKEVSLNIQNERSA